MTRRVICLLFLACTVLGSSGCSPLNPYASYRPPILPVCFTISPKGIRVSGEASLITPIGVFSLGTEYPLHDLGTNDLALILRNRRTEEDHVYVIRQGRNAQVVVDGHVTMMISTDTVTIDITDAQQVEVRYYCALEVGQRIHMESQARLWPGPTALGSDFITTLPERESYYVLTGPKWGRIRRDKDISGWWWEISERRDGVGIGWIWEGRITQCNYGLD